MPHLSPTSLLLQDTLDTLCSSHSSNSDRSSALSSLEHFLAATCGPKSSQYTPEFEAFLLSQSAFECNIPSRILSWIPTATIGLEDLMKESSNPDREELSILSSHLIQSLSIIQGVVLNHKSSKRSLGRKYSLRILLDLVLVSRHLSSPPQTAYDESPLFVAGDQSKKRPPSPQLASALLDTLLCILVDSSAALRNFEEVKGVQVVVKILKRAGTPRDVRMKCLEFLYFYLLDERTFPAPSAVQRRAGSEPCLPATMPTTPTSPKTKIDQGINDESNGKLLPAFTFELTPKPSRVSGSSDSSLLSSQRSSPRNMSPRNMSSSSSNSSTLWTSNSSFSNRTPPRDRSQSAVSTKSLLMLRREVDFVPVSPKKAQIAGLGVGTPIQSRTSSNRSHKERELARDLSRSQSENKVHMTTDTDAYIKTTEEKKELLGSMLGNVEALVEGVKKAGVWGLG